MERWNKNRNREPGNRTNSFRNGSVSIVTLFAVLGLLVLIGFVGNAGHAVSYRIETQNASDAAAISSAEWMARGMNAITATNHMLGEVTAIVTIHEALGGPEVDVGIQATIVESQVLDSTIDTLIQLAPIRGLQSYGITQALTDADEEFLKFVADRMTADKGNHRAFATIYDSKLTLKKKYAKWLMRKSIANLGLFVPPPWGYATAAAGLGVHLKSTKEIAGITKEWLILMALEEMVVQTSDLKVRVLEKQLIPALAAHAEMIAAMDQDSDANLAQAAAGGLVGHSIQDSLDHLAHSVELATFPRPFALKLPVEPEPAPTLQSGSNAPEWGGDSNQQDDSTKINFIRIVRSHIKQTNKIKKRIGRLGRDIKQLDEQETDVEQLLKDTAPNSPQAKSLETELKEIDRLRTEKRKTIEYLKLKLENLNQEFGEFMENVKQYQSMLDGRGGNLSDSPGHLPALLNQQQERHSQWVRATWPYVDALRAPILAQFENQLQRSNAKKHFVKWTNRYTLVKSWQLRSGYRFQKMGNNAGRWSKSSEVEPLQMYVMKDAYDRSGDEQKGREPWTGSDKGSKLAAEHLFTMVGLAHREFTPQFAPRFFPGAHDRGMTTYAQSIIYNANRQESPDAVVPPLVQRSVGWDTLNWDPNTETPEWGSQSTLSNAKWPWQVLSSARQSDSVKVKLNWQAKLMPATQTRIAEAALDNVNSVMGKTLGLSLLNFKELSSH
jgi:hypothetical protein